VTAYWPTDDGWPYQDSGVELADPDGEIDEDLLNVRAPALHLLDHLDPLERRVIAAHYGLNGPPRSLQQLHIDMGVPKADLSLALGSALDKLRAQLSG
jgi:DNA-directed RNA polymerase sigma subunit (sigma70/sigma32)